MDAAGLEAGRLRELAQDEERAGAGERRRPARSGRARAGGACRGTGGRARGSGGAPRRPGGRSGRCAPSTPLPMRAHEPLPRGRRRALEADRLAAPGAPRRRGARRAPGRGASAASCPSRRRSAARPRPARASSAARARGAAARARRPGCRRAPEQHLVPEEGAERRDAAGDRRRGEAVGAHLRDVACELVGRGAPPASRRASGESRARSRR